MFEKKMVPKVLNGDVATEFIGHCEGIGNILSGTRYYRIEFYNKDGRPLFDRSGIVTGLPTTIKNFPNHSFAEMQEMIAAQDKLVFVEIRKKFGLTYNDDTFKENVDRKFSYNHLVIN